MLIKSEILHIFLNNAWKKNIILLQNTIFFCSGEIYIYL